MSDLETETWDSTVTSSLTSEYKDLRISELCIETNKQIARIDEKKASDSPFG